MLREAQVKLPAYLAWVRTLPCILTGSNVEVEAAHIRYPDHRYGKRETGKGEKPHDYWAVPLCGKLHREQHGMGEKLFWRGYCVDPCRTALGLYAVWREHEGDIEKACLILENANR